MYSMGGDGRIALAFALADDELVLGHRHAEWTGWAPHIEEDLAFSSIAQDEMAHARLLYELIETAIEMGARAVSLEVRVSNWSAQRLYTRFGFRPVGVRKGYYQETGEDALVMWADDVHTAEYERLLSSIIEDASEATGE